MKVMWAVATVLAAATPQAPAEPLSWDRYQHLTGVFDVAGPLPGGRLVVAGSQQLVALDPATNQVATFGPEGGQGGEAYVTVSPTPALRVNGAGCSFAPGDVYQLRVSGSPAVTRIDPQGGAHPFAQVSGFDSLNGISFDTSGRFGHRLLVTGPHRGATTVAAIDCLGRAQTVTDSGPVLEGGLAVAPASFGAFAGDLIAPDELSGNLLAIRPDGTSAVIARPGLPTGGDIGVESLGFVPAGFEAGGDAYMADRATSNNPHPGTDSLLRLDSGRLTRVGVRAGDLLVGTEGGALTVGVRCGGSCRTFPVAQGPAIAHGEGHLLVVADHPAQAPTALPASNQLGAAARQAALLRQLGALGTVIVLAALGVGLLAWWLRRRRERRHA